MRVYAAGQNVRIPKRIAVYGDPKVGKTRLATSLPWGKEWGEKAIYVCWDPGSEELTSVLPENRDRLIRVLPGSDDPKSAWDPLEEAVAIASKDYRDTEAGTIIWDTMTYTATDILEAVSKLGLYGNNISLGKKGTKSHLSQPQMGDFGAAQRSIMHILSFLFDQPMNVIVLFHSTMTDAESGEVLGGPATVGKAGIRPISGLFDNLFRVAMKRIRVGTGLPAVWEQKRVAQTEPEGNWLAGMRTGHEKNPMAEVELKGDGSEFWRQVEAAGSTMKGNN